MNNWLLTAAESGKALNKGKELFKAEINIDESAYDVLTEESSDEVVASALEHSIAYDWQLNRDLKDIDCEEWTEFWRMYDLLQFFPNAQHKGGTAANNASVDREEIKMYYPGLEEIVDALLDHDIPFSYEGDVDLLSEEGIVIASAQMILTELKIVIDPVDEASEKVFADGGYKVITVADFSIDKIKHL